MRVAQEVPRVTSKWKIGHVLTRVNERKDLYLSLAHRLYYNTCPVARLKYVYAYTLEARYRRQGLLMRFPFGLICVQGKHCIFIETATAVSDHKRHAILECVPVGQRELDMAPGYFKKAFMVCVQTRTVTDQMRATQG